MQPGFAKWCSMWDTIFLLTDRYEEEPSEDLRRRIFRMRAEEEALAETMPSMLHSYFNAKRSHLFADGVFAVNVDVDPLGRFPVLVDWTMEKLEFLSGAEIGWHESVVRTYVSLVQIQLAKHANADVRDRFNVVFASINPVGRI